jgi:asparagine synthetase B (glutamine-hydrolysing)
VAELLHLQRWLDEASSVQARLATLDGDFLLSYVPPDATQCWLYRNVTGMRALYYRRTAHGLCWSTVIDDLFLPSGPALSDVDVTMLPLLVTAALPDPARTAYRDVLRLPAGHGLHLTPEQTMTPFAFDFALPDHRRLSLLDAAEQFRWYLSQAFQRKLGHFSRIGVLLSGGLDSAIAAKEARQVAPTVHGLHWAWPSLPILDDERVCAEVVAQQLGMELTCIDGSADLAAGGAYLRSLQGLSLSFTQAFFSSFLASAHAAAQAHLPVVIGGHLGDLLFAGEQKDGFRAQLCPPHPLNVLRMAGKLLCRYTRKQAFAVLWQLLLHPQRFTPEPLGPRIESCQAWLMPAAYQQVREQGNYVYPQVAPSASTQMTYQHLKESINSSTDTDTNLVYHAFFPQRVLLLHPYADRTLLEFCLGLGPQHREGFAAGVPISKVLARFAYLHDLPPSIIEREVRLPYSAVKQAYGVHNRHELLALLAEESCLAHLGILDAQQVAVLADDPHEFRRHCGTFSLAAGIELWLRQLAGRPYVPLPIAQRAARSTILVVRDSANAHTVRSLQLPVACGGESTEPHTYSAQHADTGGDSVG